MMQKQDILTLRLHQNFVEHFYGTYCHQVVWVEVCNRG
jgi:hypothetical protein